MSEPQAEPRSEARTATDMLTVYRRQTRFVRLLAAPTPGTNGLLAANLIVFALLQLYAFRLAGGYLDGGPYQMLLLLGAKLNTVIDAGQYWRFMTAQFLHGNLLHIAFNAYAIYVLGPMVERLFGTRRLLVIYGVAGLMGAFASYLFSDAPSVGASGAIFGLLGAVTLFGVRFKSDLPEGVGKRIVRSVAPWVLLNLAFGLIIPSVDNAAHVGGLIGGVLATLVVGSKVSDRTEHRATHVIAVGFVAVWAVSAIMMLQETGRCGQSFEQMEECYIQYLEVPDTDP